MFTGTHTKVNRFDRLKIGSVHTQVQKRSFSSHKFIGFPDGHSEQPLTNTGLIDLTLVQFTHKFTKQASVQ